MKICFRCTASKNQFRISLSRSLRRASHPKVKPLGFRRVADMRNSDSRSQSGSANQIVRSLRATRRRREPSDSGDRLIVGNDCHPTRSGLFRGTRSLPPRASAVGGACAVLKPPRSTSDVLNRVAQIPPTRPSSVERRKSSPTASQTSAGDDPGVRPRVSACAVRSATHADATIPSSLPERPIRGWYRTGTAAHSVRRRPCRTVSGSCRAAEVLRSPALANVKDAPTSWRVGGSAFGSVLGCFRASRPREPFQIIRFLRDYSSAKIRRPSNGNSANAHVATAIETVARTHLRR